MGHFIPNSGAPPIGGAINREYISVTVNTFKKFCLKAGTKKADEIHDYYIKLETLIQETLNEETKELKDQLQKKDGGWGLKGIRLMERL